MDIPASNDDSSDEEVFQHFLQRNQVTSISNPEYKSVSSTAVFSELAPVQLFSLCGKRNCHFTYLYCLFSKKRMKILHLSSFKIYSLHQHHQMSKLLYLLHPPAPLLLFNPIQTQPLQHLSHHPDNLIPHNPTLLPQPPNHQPLNHPEIPHPSFTNP